MSSIVNLNINIRALCRDGNLKEAIHILLTTHNASLHSSTYLHILQACIANKSLSEAKQLHSHINERGFTFPKHTFFQNTLINMYDKCGSLVDARQVFDQINKPNVFSWNMIIAAYRRHALPQQAFTLFHQMQRTGVQPDQCTFSSILPVCANVASMKPGLQIHAKITRCGFQSDVMVINTLIGMYAKRGRIEKARDLFDQMRYSDVVSWNAMITGYAQNGILDEALRLFKEMPQRNVVSWNAMIVGYAQNGLVDEAFDILEQMQLAGVKPNSATFASILPACAKMGAFEQGLKVHRKINESGFLSDIVVVTALIDMYAKCGDIQKAHELFDKIPLRDEALWNVIIAGYSQNGLVHEALENFRQMQLTGIKPDSSTFSSILSACAKDGALYQGMEIHQKVIEGGWLSDMVLTAVIDMYAKCRNIHKACKLFDKMSQRDVASWNVMIVGYTQNGLVDKALEIFKQMQLSGLKPDSQTFASILSPCARLGALEQGTEIHQKVIKSGFLSDVVVVTALIDMYAKCGNIQKAHKLFDEMPLKDVASWNAMIVSYAQAGLVDEALEIFGQMQLKVVNPDSSTLASILPACAKLGALEQGMELHQKIIESGFFSDVVVTALIDMYAKCGSIQKARALFDRMPQRNVVSWNAMLTGYTQNGILDDALGFFKEMPQTNIVSWTAIIAGYAQNGHVEKALELFKQIQLAGLKPNSSTFASILPACAKHGALEKGMEIHLKIIESGFMSDVVVVTALIDMYAKCGSIHKAHGLFDKMHDPGIVSWNAMIAGYAMHGYSKVALKLFEQMKNSGTNPDHGSFVCVLFACSHAGLVDDGCKYFNSISGSYCTMPTMDHYICMVDLLGRAGYLEDTLNFIMKMPIKPNVVVWISLLGTCRLLRDIGLGEFVATLLFELDPKNTAPYVLLSNIYAEVGRWGDVQKVRKLIKDRGIKKTPGCSWVEVHKSIHAFCVGDRSHPQTQQIYAMLEKLSSEMKAAGYMPDTRPVMNDVEEEEKELLLCHHSEKLAIAFGLLNTSPGTTIRVVKNLRVCGECHSATKLISKIVAREIVVRDANRFHHFKHGQCSCGDYW